MKFGYITLKIPFPDEADGEDAVAAAEAIARVALSESPGSPSEAGISPVFYGTVDRIEMRDE